MNTMEIKMNKEDVIIVLFIFFLKEARNMPIRRGNFKDGNLS